MARQWYNSRRNDKPSKDVVFADCGNAECRRTMLKVSNYDSIPNEETEQSRIHDVGNR